MSDSLYPTPVRWSGGGHDQDGRPLPIEPLHLRRDFPYAKPAGTCPACGANAWEEVSPAGIDPGSGQPVEPWRVCKRCHPGPPIPRPAPAPASGLPEPPASARPAPAAGTIIDKRRSPPRGPQRPLF